jgi:hypothetical protein
LRNGLVNLTHRDLDVKVSAYRPFRETRYTDCQN